MSAQELAKKVYAACHAVQAAMKFFMAKWSELPRDEQLGDSRFSPWALRLNGDLARADHGALARLLIEKGVFTEEEYLAALLDLSEQEKRRLEIEASERYGTTITFV